MKLGISGIMVAALALASPAAFAQNVNTGNTSVPGASVMKDDQTYKPMRSKKHTASHTRRHHAKHMSPQPQTTGSGSSPGASVNKDDSTPKSK